MLDVGWGMSTKISERPQAQKTTQKEPVTGPPPPAPTNTDDDDDAVGFEQLSTTKNKQDAFGAGATSGARLARGEFAPSAARATNDGPDLLIDDDAPTGAFYNANDAVGHMGAVPPPRTSSSTFKSEAEAIKAIEHDYGVTVAGSFSLEELSRVHESLALVPLKERAALKGVKLEREPAPPAELQNERSDGGTVAAAFFNGSEPASDGKRYPHISFYDSAFPSTTHSGDDRRLSQSVVLHEAAHAIDGGPSGKAELAFFNAQEQRKAADATAAPLAAAVNANDDAYRAAARDDPQSGAFSAANDAWTTAMSRLRETSDPQTKKKAEADLAKATKARDAALAKLPAGEVKEKAQELATSQDALVAPEKKSAAARVDEEAAVKTLRPLVADPKGADAKGVIHADTNAVAAFHKQAPTPISDYGRTKPEENFAEAYALYRRDPEALRHVSKPAYEYMKKHHP